MSDDKLLDLTPVEVTFVDGEKPSSDKLEGMMVQVAEGLEVVENTIGDAFGRSLGLENVWISNFTRDLGDRSYLNPVLLPDVTLSSYVQDLTAGSLEHEVDLIPVGSGAAIISSSADTSVVPGQFKVTVDLLDTPGDWTILSGLNEGGVLKNSRKLITHAPSSGGTVTFADVTSGRGSAFVGARHNTIPSIAQAEAAGDFLSVTLSDALNNIYTMVLPTEATVLDRLYAQGAATISNTKTGIGGGQQMKLPLFMFDPAGLDMLTDAGGGGGKIFPANMIRIYDWQEKKLVDGLEYVEASTNAGNREYEIICKFRSDITLDTVSGEYILVTAGTSLSEMIGAIQRDLVFHKHDGDDMIRSIKHSSTVGLRTGDVGLDRSRYYGPSNIDNNDHSMYFHRDGYTGADSGAGANVVRGDIVIGSNDTGSEPDHENDNLDTDSFELIFGKWSTGPKIYFDKVRTHSLPSAEGNIPQNYSDTSLVLEGSLDDGTSTIKTVLVDGNLRVDGDVVLGTATSHDVVLPGDIYIGQTAVFKPAADPIASRTPEEGMVAYNSNSKSLEYYDGTDVKTLESRDDRLGDIQYSMLTEGQFQSQRDTTWVLMDGRSVVGSDYETLTGDSSIPDARGQFLRGKNNGRVDGNEDDGGERTLGTFQDFNTSGAPLTVNSHTHTINHTHSNGTAVNAGNHSHTTLSGGVHNGFGSGATGNPLVLPANVPSSTNGLHSHTVTVPTHSGSSGSSSPGVAGDSETNPRNIVTNIFIKINKAI